MSTVVGQNQIKGLALGGN